MSKTYFTFYGARGSYPVADETMIKYGGNTTSLLVESGNDIVIFDLGTGIIKLGEYLKDIRDDIKEINIFITHFHLDHLMGASFFYPFSNKEYKIKIHYPKISGIDINSALFDLFEPPYSPIGKDAVLAEIEMIPLDINNVNSIEINKDLRIETYYDPLHPKHGVMLYKALNTEGKKLVFATDIEPENEFSNELKEFIKNADVLIHDAQYLEEDYYDKDSPTKGYGHSTFTMAVNNAIEANTEKLYLFHHNPLYSDKKLENILKKVRKKFKNSFLAKEYKKNIL